ncbi:MAG: WYL domain-containing protein [Muribaculaceae bacterium]|nr:WYL domain-containing protein [Muribaculaceae bacterium]
MGNELLNRYIWLVDTIRRYGRITRQELDDCWQRSQFSDGETTFSRRTFYNYRQAVEDLFDIQIKCDPATFEYFIADEDAHNESVTEWLLNSAATNDVLSSSRDISQKIFLEDVPSARQHLAIVIGALKASSPIRFDYHPYTKSTPTTGIVIEPYFLKIFRQRWYLTGRVVAENRIKTYALDRISSPTVLAEQFTPDPSFDAETYSRDSFGIIFSQGDVKDIVIRTDARQAKYFRALPLHHSQQEMIHDDFSNFTYRMRITDDLVAELLSYGPKITVVSPPELRAIIRERLTASLANY